MLRGQRCACGRQGRKGGGAWTSVWRPGSRRWAGRGLLGRAGGGGARGPGEGGAAARGGLWRPECHTRGGSGGGGSGSGRRRRDGHGRAGSGGRRLLPSVAGFPAVGPGSPQPSQKGRRGGRERRQVRLSAGNPGQDRDCASDGQQRAPQQSAERPERGAGGARAFRSLRGRGPGSHETCPRGARDPKTRRRAAEAEGGAAAA